MLLTCWTFLLSWHDFRNSCGVYTHIHRRTLNSEVCMRHLCVCHWSITYAVSRDRVYFYTHRHASVKRSFISCLSNEWVLSAQCSTSGVSWEGVNAYTVVTWEALQRALWPNAVSCLHVQLDTRGHLRSTTGVNGLLRSMRCACDNGVGSCRQWAISCVPVLRRRIRPI